MTINWERISPEDFQSLSISLLFREGYRDIIALGSRGVKESGKDAIEPIYTGKSKDFTSIIFQFKRWTSAYSAKTLKRKIKDEIDNKVLKSGEKVKQYILVTSHPLSTIKEWLLKDLPQDYDFPIYVFEQTWIENRLDNESQDLRRKYFGLDIERHSYTSLLETCKKQVDNTTTILRSRYIPEIYVNRDIEKDFDKFLESDKACFTIVDRAGRGKTNLICHLANKIVANFPTVLILGSRHIVSEDDLANQIFQELGYAGPKGTRWQANIDDLEQVVLERDSKFVVFVDGVSENNNIPLMKNALRELLLRYGDKKHFKFCITCRDILWPRVMIDLPVEHLYQTSLQEAMSERQGFFSGLVLGNWSESEFNSALEKYFAYFNVSFILEPDIRSQCKYPLILRLLCETHTGKSLGSIRLLPISKVFENFLEAKAQRIADFFELNLPPEKINRFLLNVREMMWVNDDSSQISEEEFTGLLEQSWISQAEAIKTRMLDEGLLIKVPESDDTVFLRFAFDELSDYLLYLYFMSSSKGLTNQQVIQQQIEILNGGDQEKIYKAEKFLSLISRSLDSLEDLESLLAKTINADLFIFSVCAWQRNLIDLYEGKSEQEKALIFAEKLVKGYQSLISNYFGNLTLVINPYIFAGDDAKSIGVELTVSPKFREVNYFYKLDENKINFTDSFPTWSLSLRPENGQELKLHDPERGIIMSNMRGPDRVYRIVDFEWNSPFSGVSMSGPDRLALYDLWEELKNIIKSHYLSEPYTLLQERAAYVAQKLPTELANISELEKYRIIADTLLSKATNPREKIELNNNIDEFRYYLSILKKNIFAFRLPEPDIPQEDSTSIEIWKRYSDDQLVNYLSVFFSTFVQTYRRIVENNFKSISHRMNFYNQWPAEMILAMDRKKEVIRIFSVPHLEESGLKIANIPPDVSVDLSVGKLSIDEVAYDALVKEALKTLRRGKTNSYPVDRIVNLKDLFVETPLNNFTYLWINSEIANILQIPFSGHM